jgi:hypothetical protein
MRLPMIRGASIRDLDADLKSTNNGRMIDFMDCALTLNDTVTGNGTEECGAIGGLD